MSFLDDLLKKVGSALKNAISEKAAEAVNGAVNNNTFPRVFVKLPESLDELKSLPGADLKDPYWVAAFAVAAFCEYPHNKDNALEMINYLKGPRPLVPSDISFIRDRYMDGNDYVPRSYFEGTSPENDYTPSVPYTVNVMELAHSRDQFGEGYLRLFLRSSGADSERYVVLRNKPSTQQWFLWTYEGILSGIRQPQSKNEWA